jgi:hypothetical protein
MSKKLERYLEWLAREEIPPESAEAITNLRAALRSQLGLVSGERLPRNMNQLQALKRAATFMAETAPKYGVQAVSYTTRGKIQTRYTITGKKGLFGIRTAIKTLLSRSG